MCAANGVIACFISPTRCRPSVTDPTERQRVRSPERDDLVATRMRDARPTSSAEKRRHAAWSAPLVDLDLALEVRRRLVDPVANHGDLHDVAAGGGRGLKR